MMLLLLLVAIGCGSVESYICLIWSADGSSHIRVHPKFLHSNATSHKWVFGGGFDSGLLVLLRIIMLSVCAYWLGSLILQPLRSYLTMLLTRFFTCNFKIENVFFIVLYIHDFLIE